MLVVMKIDPNQDLSLLSDAELVSLTGNLVQLKELDRRENALFYYEPANPTVAKIHNLVCGTIGIFGGNGCIPLGESVLMADGSRKPLGEIIPGDLVMAADPVTREAMPSSVVKVYRSGMKEVFEVTFSDGGSVRATAEHMIPMYTRAGARQAHPYKLPLVECLKRLNGNPVSRASMVSPRDYVFTQRTPLTVDPYLLGTLLGDGSLGKHSLKFSNTNAKVLERVRTAVAPYGLRLSKYNGCDYGIVGDQHKPHLLKIALKELGIWGHSSYTKFIPKQYLTANRKERAQLLAGLVDTDGSRNSYSSCSKNLADGVVFLVKSLGGKATISERVTSDQRGTQVHSFRVYWRLVESLDLACAYKQVNTHSRQIDYTRRVCRSVKSVGMMECGDIQVAHPAHCYITKDYVIVGNSGKTEHALVEGIIRCTGQVPASLKDTYPREKLRGPIHMRVVCESLTTVLDPIILPKLQWYAWSGIPQSTTQGHWGWIPRHCLIQGDWKKSYDKRLRILTVAYRNPDTDAIEGWSTIQFMSYDQDASDFASGDLQYCLHDEPPTFAIWRENRSRVMRGGNGSTILVSMTWPDNPAMPVDWIFDEIYDKGTPGVLKDNDVEVINIYTTMNPHLDQESVKLRAGQMTTLERNTRIYGLPIRFSNRIHPDFTDQSKQWCYECGKMVIFSLPDTCGECGGTYVSTYCNVEAIEVIKTYPCYCLLDPHPRKPHMLAWIQVTANEEYEVIRERLVKEGADEVKRVVDEVEAELQHYNVFRLMDPNMGASPSGATRELTWQTEFDNVGLHFDLADRSDVGRSRLNDFLKPDPQFQRPRFRIDPSCTNSIFQMKRYVWADYVHAERQGLKQIPMEMNDDFPTLFKYMMNRMPQYMTPSTKNVIRKDRSQTGYVRGIHANRIR